MRKFQKIGSTDESLDQQEKWHLYTGWVISAVVVIGAIALLLR